MKNEEIERPPRHAGELRATVLAEMFLGLGKEATPERVSYYIKHAGNVDPGVLRSACDAAVLSRSDDWVPGPGEIMRQVRRIVGKRREEAKDLERCAIREATRRQVLEERAGEATP